MNRVALILATLGLNSMMRPAALPAPWSIRRRNLSPGEEAMKNATVTRLHREMAAQVHGDGGDGASQAAWESWLATGEVDDAHEDYLAPYEHAAQVVANADAAGYARAAAVVEGAMAGLGSSYDADREADGIGTALTALRESALANAQKPASGIEELRKHPGYATVRDTLESELESVRDCCGEHAAGADALAKLLAVLEGGEDV